jgi:hypothetical protein
MGGQNLRQDCGHQLLAKVDSLLIGGGMATLSL